MKLMKLSTVMDDKKVGKADLAVKTGLSVETIENARKGRSVSGTTWTLIAAKLKVDKEALV
jgi:DNA-binding Xre family transcriptional regulator